MNKVISISNLSVSFKNKKIINNVNMDIIKGKTTAIVGESGSGKTLTALSILKLLPNNAKINSGKIFFENKDILSENDGAIQKMRGKKFTNDDDTYFYKKHKIYIYKEDFKNFSDFLNETMAFIFENRGQEVISERHQKNYSNGVNPNS